MYQIYVDNELFCDSMINELAIIKPVMTAELNSVGSFSFKIPPKHPMYNKIIKRKSIIDVYRDEEMIFSCVCISEKIDFYKQKEIKCESVLTFLNDSVQRPARIQGKTVRQILELYIRNHNEQTEELKHFEVGEVTVNDPYISCYTNYNSTLKEIKEDLVDDLGGFLRIRYDNGVRYIDYLGDADNTNTQVIKLGENLIDFESNLDTTDLATVVIPLGATLEESTIQGLDERLTIAGINEGKDYVESPDAIETYGRIQKVVTWDNVTVAANLKAKAQKYLTDSQFESVYFKAKIIDLHYDNKEVESIKLYDSIRVYSKPHGLDRYFFVTKITSNLNEPEKDTITLGNVVKFSLTTKTDTTNDEIKKKVDNITPASTILQSAANNATQILQNSQNGFITTVVNEDGHPTELLIMDAMTQETASRLWKWNVNGLGYGSRENLEDDFEFGTAMTMDGGIVADYITTGEINGITYNLYGLDAEGKQRLAMKLEDTWIEVHNHRMDGDVVGWVSSTIRTKKNNQGNVVGEQGGLAITGNDDNFISMLLLDGNNVAHPSMHSEYDDSENKVHTEFGGVVNFPDMGTRTSTDGGLSTKNGLVTSWTAPPSSNTGGTIFSNNPSGGITVSNGLVTNWSLQLASVEIAPCTGIGLNNGLVTGYYGKTLKFVNGLLVWVENGGHQIG